MVQIIFTILVALVLYLLPGYLFLFYFNTQDLYRINRFILALVISLVILPYASITFANIIPFKPGFIPWFIFNIFLIVTGWLYRHTLSSRSLTGDESQVSKEISRPVKLEVGLVLVFIILFSMFINLPRSLMFFQGGQAIQVQPWDENWHIQQLVSVARTGIPPQHYFFPSAKLSYYYASWIYPAILGNLPGIDISLLRAMAIHVFLQIFAFLGLIYVLLQYNIKSWWVRIAGLGLFTVFGGFDLFAKLPSIEFIDWWQKDPSFLTGIMQISQFATLYTWVPHHVAAAMGFVFIIYLWKNFYATDIVKIVLTGICLGFIFTTSPFVFLFTSLGLLIILISRWKLLLSERKKAFIYLVSIFLVFFIAAWYLLTVYSQHRGSLTWSDLRINVVERFRGGSEPLFLIDRSLTLLGLPLTMSVFLLVDLGLAYVLYILWWAKQLFCRTRILQNEEALFLGAFPVISFIAILLIKDQGGGRNFSMRGFLPGQIVIVLTAIKFIDEATDFFRKLGWRKWILAYIALCFLVAQSLSTLAEVRSTSVEVVKLALWEDCGWKSILRPFNDFESCLPEDEFRYINWINMNTPKESIILEMGPFIKDHAKLRWLERNRLMMPNDFLQLEFFYFDMDFISNEDWENIQKESARFNNVYEYYMSTNFRGKSQQPAYLVIHGETPVPFKTDGPVYQDAYVSIYKVIAH